MKSGLGRLSLKTRRRDHDGSGSSHEAAGSADAQVKAPAEDALRVLNT